MTRKDTRIDSTYTEYTCVAFVLYYTARAVEEIQLLLSLFIDSRRKLLLKHISLATLLLNAKYIHSKLVAFKMICLTENSLIMHEIKSNHVTLSICFV